LQIKYKPLIKLFLKFPSSVCGDCDKGFAGHFR